MSDTYLLLPEEPVATRKGKIGCLPRAIRNELNRRLGQHDQVIALSRQRYQRETMELFLKGHENKKVREILESDGDNSAKIELLGREIFGDLWDDGWPGTVKEVKEN